MNVFSFVVVVLSLMLGCTDTGSETGAVSSCFDVAPHLSIGTGESEWLPLESGDAVTMVHGPQGGWHILGSVRLDNTDQIVVVDYSVHVAETGELIADDSYRVALVLDEECSGYFPGMYAYLDVSSLAEGEADTPPELLAYEDVVLSMSVTDSSDRMVASEITVLAVPDPVDLLKKKD
jgi:hypothetical protein